MLVDLYPRVHRRYSSLAIIGPILDGYGTWLLKQGYSTERTREHFQAAPRLVRGLQWLGHASVTTTNRYATVDLDMKRKALAKARPTALDTAGLALWRTDTSVLEWLEAL